MALRYANTTGPTPSAQHGAAATGDAHRPEELVRVKAGRVDDHVGRVMHAVVVGDDPADDAGRAALADLGGADVTVYLCAPDGTVVSTLTAGA